MVWLLTEANLIGSVMAVIIMVIAAAINAAALATAATLILI